jgi:hypothetical protein
MVLSTLLIVTKGPDSSVGIATRYGLDVSNLGVDDIFRTCPDLL